MQITPVSKQTNPNFQALKVSNRALKGLGCTREDILKNEFIRTLYNDADISINSLNGSIFKKATEFVLKIGKPLIEFSSPFKTLDELSEKTDEIKEDYYFKNAIKKYSVEYKAFQSLEKEENIEKFLKQMDYIMLSIASIPNTPQYKRINEYFLSVLQKMRFWKPLPRSHKALPEINKIYWEKAKIDTTESAGLRALKSNNLELLKFLKGKNENLNQCLDYIKTNSVSDEVKEILKDVKYQDAKIFEIENMISDSYTLRTFLEKNPNLDINSRNKNGDTLVHKAIREGNVTLLKYLSLRDDVDWNAYDANGMNVLMNAVLDNNIYIAYRLCSLPNGTIDTTKCSVVKDYNSSYLTNPFTYMIRNYRIGYSEFFKMKDLDVMYRLTPKDSPLIFETIEEGLPSEFLVPMLTNKSLDINQKSNDGKNLFECVDSVKDKHPSIFGVFKHNLPDIIINEAKKLYDENGELTLEQIDKFLDALIDKKAGQLWLLRRIGSFNVIGDKIGHLLCDTYVDVNDKEKMEVLSKILKKLKKYGYDFNAENEIGQTPLSRAIESENYGLIKLLFEVQKNNRWD